MEIKGKLKKFEVAARLETDAYGASCPSASIELTPQELADQLTLPEIETVRAFRCMMEVGDVPQPEKEEKWCGCKEPIYCLGCVEPICYKCRNPIKPPEKKIEPIDQIDYGYSKKATIEDCVIWIMQDGEKLKELIKIINER